MNQKYGLHCSKKFCDQLKIQVAAHSTNSVFGLRRRTVKNKERSDPKTEASRVVCLTGRNRSSPTNPSTSHFLRPTDSSESGGRPRSPEIKRLYDPSQ
jgi:hypothetical protein